MVRVRGWSLFPMVDVYWPVDSWNHCLSGRRLSTILSIGYARRSIFRTRQLPDHVHNGRYRHGGGESSLEHGGLSGGMGCQQIRAVRDTRYSTLPQCTQHHWGRRSMYWWLFLRPVETSSNEGSARTSTILRSGGELQEERRDRTSSSQTEPGETNYCASPDNRGRIDAWKHADTHQLCHRRAGWDSVYPLALLRPQHRICAHFYICISGICSDQKEPSVCESGNFRAIYVGRNHLRNSHLYNVYRKSTSRAGNRLPDHSQVTRNSDFSVGCSVVQGNTGPTEPLCACVWNSSHSNWSHTHFTFENRILNKYSNF